MEAHIRINFKENDKREVWLKLSHDNESTHIKLTDEQADRLEVENFCHLKYVRDDTHV